ncbi:uncharacterized protein CDAR_428081 [Caerostris darwini]|uniref:Uncharacterized protein n=1 Tax=Caerostris darwini TaxID=1538125 RepID=A0AAV4Q7X0_9ARAC|nr:uncharacterized protein CDAR_428081 [Caerostris darwini]
MYESSQKFKYEESTGNLVDVVNNKSYEADPEIAGHPAYYTFQSELYARKWIACCRAALDCCSRMLSEPFTEDNGPKKKKKIRRFYLHVHIEIRKNLNRIASAVLRSNRTKQLE